MTNETASPANGKNAPASASSPTGQPRPSDPPLFYVRPEPISTQTHRTFKVRPEFDFSFAAATNTVPITVPEFGMAARHYPIMFLGPDLVPTAAVGFNPQSNLFVNAKGEWAMNQYIPGYVRRYPFILLGNESDDRLHLGIDATGHSIKPDARPLYDGEKDSPTLTQSITICEQFHGAFLFTRNFSAALKEASITEERGVEIRVAPDKTQTIGSFSRINEEKFNQLPDATILDWHKKGFIYAVYFHLQSMNNWDLLLARNAMLAQGQAAV